MTAALAALAIGGVIGSVPFAWLLHHVATGRDLRREGSGNPGATNVERTVGPALAAAALVLDMGKGAVAVLVAWRWAGAAAGAPAALGAVLGHVFTPWLGGRGGKGVATTAGAYALLAPAATGGAVLAFVLVVVATGYVSLGSVVGAAALPIAILIAGAGDRAAAIAAAIAVVIAWRHRENFARMRAGTEPRLGRRAPGRGGTGVDS